MALLRYEDEHGSLPPAIVHGKDGQPLYSWRVLLLPYVEEDELYAQFHLDEPWDSEHNLPLLSRMPHTYKAPWTREVDVPPHHTVVHVFVGPGTPFESNQKIRLKDFKDGRSNTLLFVEAGKPVPWTKPEELTFDPKHPIQLQGLFRNGFRAGMADGGRRYVARDTASAFLRKAITHSGGEIADFP